MPYYSIKLAIAVTILTAICGSINAQIDCENYYTLKMDGDFETEYAYLDEESNSFHANYSQIHILPNGHVISLGFYEQYILIQKFDHTLTFINKNKIPIQRGDSKVFIDAINLNNQLFVLSGLSENDSKSQSYQSIICEKIDMESLSIVGDQIFILDGIDPIELQGAQIPKNDFHSSFYFSISPDRKSLGIVLHHKVKGSENGRLFVKVLDDKLSEIFHHSFPVKYEEKKISHVWNNTSNEREVAIVLTLTEGEAMGTSGDSQSLYLVKNNQGKPVEQELMMQFENYNNESYKVRSIIASFENHNLYWAANLDGKSGGPEKDQMLMFVYDLNSNRKVDTISILPLDYLSEAEAIPLFGKAKEDKYHAISMEFMPFNIKSDSDGNIYVISALPYFVELKSTGLQSPEYMPVNLRTAVMKFNVDHTIAWTHIVTGSILSMTPTLINNKLHLLCNSYIEVASTSDPESGEAIITHKVDPAKYKSFDITFDGSGASRVDPFYEKCDTGSKNIMSLVSTSALDQSVLVVYSTSTESEGEDIYLHVIKYLSN